MAIVVKDKINLVTQRLHGIGFEMPKRRKVRKMARPERFELPAF
jgi:hypothetical protein